MYVDLAEVIQSAIHETMIAFFTADIGLKVGPSLIKSEETPYIPPQADVTAIVAFNGAMEGGVHLAAPLHAALLLATGFAGEPFESFNDMAKDSIGELANIIAGAVKSRISDSICLTPPQVVVGTNHKISFTYTHTLESTKCFFKTNQGPFFVEVFYKKL